MRKFRWLIGNWYRLCWVCDCYLSNPTLAADSWLAVEVQIPRLWGRISRRHLTAEKGTDPTPPDKCARHKPIFVASTHQTGLDTRSMTRRSIKVEIRVEGGRARALVTMMRLAHPKVVQPKPGPYGLKSTFAGLSLLLDQRGVPATSHFGHWLL